MCFYNRFTGFLKFFYYYEGDRQSQGTQWYMKTADGTNSTIFNFTNYLASGDTSHNINMAVFSNQVGDPTKGLEPGWNGFEFEVPYCTDYKNIDFIVGAYDKTLTTYDFSGDVKLNTTGTITPMGSSSGWQSSVANVAGKGAKSLVDKLLKNNHSTDGASESSSGKIGKMLANAISNIPVGGYAQAISAGLSLIFGKSTTVNNYDVKLTTSGKVEFQGSGTSEATSGIPAVTFNLYSFMNTDKNVNSSSCVYNLANGQEHYLGVWNLSCNPFVYYRRITKLQVNIADGAFVGDGKYHFMYSIKPPINYDFYHVNINPDLKEFIKSHTLSTYHMICNKIGGEDYKSKMIDITDFLHPDFIYKDEYLELYSVDGVLEMDFYLSPSVFQTKENFYYDWGNIDCGRMVVSVLGQFNYVFNGKKIDVLQTHIYPAEYRMEMSFVEDVPCYDQGHNMIVNRDNPFYEQKKKIAGIPIIDYED